MELTQDITLRLTEAECRGYVIELGELEGIADSLSPGGLNTETGLTVLHKLRDLFEKHGLGIRQQKLETEVAYLKDAWMPKYQPQPVPPGVRPQVQAYVPGFGGASSYPPPSNGSPG